MKKLLVSLLAVALCVSMLASCEILNKIPGLGNLIGGSTPTETTPAGTTPAETTPAETTPDEPVDVSNVDAAADYVYNLYKNKTITAADFDVTNKVAIFQTDELYDASTNKIATVQTVTDAINDLDSITYEYIKSPL